jgi:hypothetical protein
VSYDDLMAILMSKPDYLHTPEDELPFIVKRVKVPSSPLSKLKFDPNKIARKIFEFENFYEAIRWRIKNHRINHRLYTGETGEGKTTVAIAQGQYLTEMKRKLFKQARNIQFTIDHNFLLGQFVSLKSQVLYQKFKRYEEIEVDEFELCVNRMRSSSGQNLDARNTLDAGRYRYNPISGICPSIGSIDKEISSTKMVWNVIAEYNKHRKKTVDVIVKYNVHSRDNYEYRWVTFIEMEVEWCETKMYREASEVKRRMIETVEGLTSKEKYLKEQIDDIMKREKRKKDFEADQIIKLYKEGEIDRKEAAWRIYNQVNPSKNYVADKLHATWKTIDKYIKEKEKEYEEGKLSEDQVKEIID